MANSGFNLPGGLKAGPVTIDATTGAITTSGNITARGWSGTNAPGGAPAPAPAGSTDVKLLLNFNGSNDSTTFTDSSSFARTVTRVGNTVLKTATKKYGTASAYFDGTGDWLTVPASSDFDFGTGNFTVECWVYLTHVSARDVDIIAQRNDGANFGSEMWFMRINSTGSVRLYNKVGNVATLDVTSATGLVTTNAWHHIAIVRNGTSVKTYVNGTQATSSTLASDKPWCYVSTIPLSIGAGAAILTYASGSEVLGHMDDVRIIKGQALYTANFTPPGAELTTTI